jgi:hypothetical protein
MNRQTFALLALAGVIALGATVAADQAAKPATPAAPTGGQGKLVAPIRGIAQIGYLRPVVKPAKIGGKDFVVTTIRVKNMADGSIAGLRVEEFWYDKGGTPITGDDYRHPKPLQPGEVITVTLETPRQPNMDRNQYSFKHANGEIRATLQKTL